MTQVQTGCLLCEEKEGEPLFLRNGKSFVRCPRCGLIYDDSPPSVREIQEYYEKTYYENFGERTSLIQKARHSLYRDFFSECERFRRTGRLLDIGCGYGDFLKRAQERGWEVWGIEPSRQASESARRELNAEILNQNIEKVDFPEDYFDVITLWNVIDCLPDPRGAIRKIRQWLSPGGRLVIRTPNASFHLNLYRFFIRFRSLLERIGWKKEASVFLQSNFDSRTLRKLLEEERFSKIQIRNGKPTQGDAYQVFARARLMEWAKGAVYTSAQFVALLTGNHLFIGTNLMASAAKGSSPSKFLPGSLRIRIFVKRVVLHILAVVGYLFGFPLWSRWLGKDRQIRILRYHSVNESHQSDVNVQESEFKRQLDFLSRRYRVIPLEEAVRTLEKGELPQEATVALTFDDGTEDNYKIVYPLLRSRRLPATIFLLASGEDSERRLLSWNQVREMGEGGIAFGSHGRNHVRLKDCPIEEMRFQIFDSKKKIESETSQPVDFFAYPYGTVVDFGPETQSLIRETGYRAAFSAIFGTNNFSTDRWSLRRIGVEASDTLFTLRAKLNGALDLLALFDLPIFRRVVRWMDSLLLRSSRTGSIKPSPYLLVSMDFPPHQNGVSTISRELSDHIARQGQPVLVIGPKDEGDREFDRSRPYRVFRLPGYEWGYLRFFPVLLTMPFVVWRWKVRKVFAMNVAYGGVLSWALSRILPLEYLVFAYGYEFGKVKNFSLLRNLYLKIYQRAKQVVACSELVKERLVRFGVPQEKIVALYPAVDLERYHPQPVPHEYLEKKGLLGKKILLSVGRLIERKGHDQVLKVLPKIIQNFPGVLFCIVGFGDYEKELRRIVQKLQLENFVRFMGEVSEEELVLLYNACDVFLMPSREIEEEGHVEGFGIVYLEANACAKPVIGGRSGGVCEAIREGVTGFLIDPYSPDEIREKIVYLLSHPEEAQKLGRQGREWVQKEFSWDRYAEAIRRILSEGS